MSRLLRHIHCVQRAIVLESLIPLHLVHSTEQQLLRYGEGYCHVKREVCTVITQSNHCLLSKLDELIKWGRGGVAGDSSGFCPVSLKILRTFKDNVLVG